MNFVGLDGFRIWSEATEATSYALPTDFLQVIASQWVALPLLSHKERGRDGRIILLGIVTAIGGPNTSDVLEIFKQDLDSSFFECLTTSGSLKRLIANIDKAAR